MKSETLPVLVEKCKNYIVIHFNRPKRKNAFIAKMYLLITKSLNEAAKDDDIRFVILTGTGDYFTSGADITDPSRNQDYSINGRPGRSTFRLFVEALIKFPKPLIAAVNGPAIGVGSTMLGLCDLVLASDSSSFLTPFSRVGIVPEACSSYTFPKIMGSIKATEMLIFNRHLNAEEAMEAGLVADVFPQKTFWKEVLNKIESALDFPQNSFLYSKSLLRAVDKNILLETNRQECERTIERIISGDPALQTIKFKEQRRKHKSAIARL